jgi:DNA-directed RNA polymerase sigma subunit (sigma70/sigma32)
MSSQPPDPVGDYFRRVESVPPLSAQEESELWLAIKTGEGTDAANIRLIEAHLALVIQIARRYDRPDRHFPDVVQEGNVALVRAIEKFDPSAGARFSAFATPLIEDAINKAYG